MISCAHKTLVLLPGEKGRLRCKHCHLLITAEELGKSHCPECFEARRDKRYDFEEVQPAQEYAPKYRCEDCGVIIYSSLSRGKI